jgi:hypothetical protein
MTQGVAWAKALYDCRSSAPIDKGGEEMMSEAIRTFFKRSYQSRRGNHCGYVAITAASATAIAESRRQ